MLNSFLSNPILIQLAARAGWGVIFCFLSLFGVFVLSETNVALNHGLVAGKEAHGKAAQAEAQYQPVEETRRAIAAHKPVAAAASLVLAQYDSARAEADRKRAEADAMQESVEDMEARDEPEPEPYIPRDRPMTSVEKRMLYEIQKLKHDRNIAAAQERITRAQSSNAERQAELDGRVIDFGNRLMNHFEGGGPDFGDPSVRRRQLDNTLLAPFFGGPPR